MKVVKNTCYGGFGLSPEAIAKLIEWDSDLIEKNPLSDYFGDRIEGHEINSFDDFLDFKEADDNRDEMFDGQDVRDWYESKYHSMVVDGIKYYYEERISNPQFFHFDEEESFYQGLPLMMRDHRDHPDLVKVIEDLGEKANGPHADLSVVSIPDGMDYKISDYDGVETIAEPHQTW